MKRASSFIKPPISEIALGAGLPREGFDVTKPTVEDAITRRALAFARTFKWVNARVTSYGQYDVHCVTRYGTPENAEYGEVRMLIDWSEADKRKILAECKPEESDDARAVLDSPMELRVVCSAKDVIYHEFSKTDLD